MKWPRPGPESEAMRSQAERVIEASGDGRAIRQLGGLRRDPRAWGSRLIKLAADSPVLKIALGVFLGIIAADAVRGAHQGDLLQSLSAEVDAAIEGAGGTEALESLAAIEASDAAGERWDNQPMADAVASDDSSNEEPTDRWDDADPDDLAEGFELPF
jgi:hypothetical protein